MQWSSESSWKIEALGLCSPVFFPMTNRMESKPDPQSGRLLIPVFSSSPLSCLSLSWHTAEPASIQWLE